MQRVASLWCVGQTTASISYPQAKVGIFENFLLVRIVSVLSNTPEFVSSLVAGLLKVPYIPATSFSRDIITDILSCSVSETDRESANK